MWLNSSTRIVIGMGPGEEVAASRLLAAGKQVAVIERELIGGECAYWACIPSKTLIRGPEAVAEATRAAGATTPTLNWLALRDYRDWMIRHLDDTGQIHGYEKHGATVVKAAGRITGPGTVQAGGHTLTAEHVILATGSEPIRPPVDGLDQVRVWTNREATTVRDIPDQVLLLGGSAVGVELGQFYARAGAQVTIVQRGRRTPIPSAWAASTRVSRVHCAGACAAAACRSPPAVRAGRPGGWERANAMIRPRSASVMRRLRPAPGPVPSPSMPSASNRASRSRTVCR